jgi:hypothetical protein
MSYAILRKKTFTLVHMAPLIMFAPLWQLTCKIITFQPIGFLKLKQIYNWMLSLITKTKYNVPKNAKTMWKIWLVIIQFKTNIGIWKYI